VPCGRRGLGIRLCLKTGQIQLLQGPLRHCSVGQGACENPAQAQVSAHVVTAAVEVLGCMLIKTYVVVCPHSLTTIGALAALGLFCLQLCVS